MTALEEFQARKPLPFPEYEALMCRHLEELGHDLHRDEDGDIDTYRLDVDPSEWDSRGHNGPGCKKCHKVWCVWCEENGIEKLEPCRAA